MKKNIIIITSTILSVVAISLIAYYVTINNKKGKAKEEYYSQWTIENQESLTRSSVENYLAQDKTESSYSRLKRLKEYFTPDSPVYSYPLENIKDSVTKSSGKVTNIKECDEQEGGDLCLLVSVDLSLTSDQGKKEEIKTYWITIKKINDQFKAYELGVWEE